MGSYLKPHTEDTTACSMQHHSEQPSSWANGTTISRFQVLTKDSIESETSGCDDSGSITNPRSHPPAKLREACTCEQCIDPTDHQRHFVWAEIPTNISIATCEIDSEGVYSVTWQNDIPGYKGHVSRYTKGEIEQLSQRDTPAVTKLGQRPKRLWCASNFDIAENTISYQAFMNDDTALAHLLHLVSRDGLAFINGVPGETNSVNKLAERVGPLRPTFYGETWDVKSMADATNVAFTSRYLGFHMDMLYVREPPGLQFLHCIENTCVGGESRFADTFNAADQLVTQAGQEVFTTLTSMGVTYHYSRPGTMTSSTKPIFDTKAHESKPRHTFSNATSPTTNTLHRIYWSPPFTGRALCTADDKTTTTQLKAAQTFHQILEHKSSYIKTKVPAGTCAIFDNLRVVHAREAFDLNSGNRWLRVAYLDDSDFMSRALTMVDLMPKSTVTVTD